MRITKTPGLLLVPALISALCLGCGSSGDEVIAKVGDYDVTVREFEDYYGQSRFPFPTAQDEFNAKRELLDSMVVTRLLVQGAYEKNLDKSEELSRVVLANKDRFLLDALYKTQIVSKSQATEVEVKDFYNHLEFKIRAYHIVVDDLDTAEALIERISAGENFEKLAYDYSSDPSAKRNRGDLGYFFWGAMVPEFQEVAFKMEPGQISPPVKSQFGYHIIKLVDRLPNESWTTFELMNKEIESQLTQQKVGENTRAYFEKLKENYPVRVDTSVCQYLLRKREEMYPPQLLESLPRNDFDPEALDRDEKELVLAQWQGGQITINEYLETAKLIAARFRPDFDDYDSLAIFIFESRKLDMLGQEALRLGLDNDEEYLRKIKLFRELTMADIMRNDSLPMPPPADEDQIRAYYDDHPEKFMSTAKVQVFEILLSDELKARKLKEGIKHVALFMETAMDLTERTGKRAAKGDLGFFERAQYPEIFDLAIKTDVGKIGGPVVTLGKYSIFWVADKVEPELKDYLGQKRQIIQTIEVERKHAAMEDWLSQRREETSIELFEDALWNTIDQDKYAVADSTGR